MVLCLAESCRQAENEDGEAAAGGRLLRKPGKIKYIWLLLSLLSLLSFLTILRRGRWEIAKKTWKNEIYLVVVVIVDYF